MDFSSDIISIIFVIYNLKYYPSILSFLFFFFCGYLNFVTIINFGTFGGAHYISDFNSAFFDKNDVEKI